ncbi:MAG: hypothetical protein AAFV62_15245, partial [Pseudomonadota bacterium]
QAEHDLGPAGEGGSEPEHLSLARFPYEETLDYMPLAGDGKLKEVFDAFNEINLSLDLQDAALPYAPYIDGALLPDLFDGKTR